MSEITKYLDSLGGAIQRDERHIAQRIFLVFHIPYSRGLEIAREYLDDGTDEWGEFVALWRSNGKETA